MWENLKNKSRQIETRLDSLERKRTGSYYTDLELTERMMTELYSNIKSSGKTVSELRFLEPCVGSGNFVFAYLKVLKDNDISSDEANSVIDNIYVADINRDALNGYSSSLKSIVCDYWGIDLDEDYFSSHIGSGLLIDLTKEELKYTPIEEVFSAKIIKDGFDIVVTNPPYKNLKAERGHYSNDTEYEIDKIKYASIKSLTKGFKYSTDGVMNLYKLFVEEIIDKYAKKDAFVSLLIPSSILSDKTCMKLRTHILADNCLLSVRNMGENSGYIDAQQALSALLIRTGQITKNVSITKDYVHHPLEETVVSISDILNENSGNAIISLSDDEYKRLKILRKHPCIKELSFINNSRGELDLTANKKYITSKVTEYPLLRGRNVGYYSIVDMDNSDFVEPAFVDASAKSIYIKSDRIICQQIANMHKERRVTFAYCKENYVLGNSCNFISISENEYGIDIYALLGLFNTKIVNWLFKLTSSNNHVNNYEIDSFPVPVGAPELKEISELVKVYLDNYNEELMEKIEYLAEKAYGLVKKDNGEGNPIINSFLHDINYIIPKMDYEKARAIILGELTIDTFCDSLEKFEVDVVKSIAKKYTLLYEGKLLNHTTFKLSDLDLEMIKSVPPGGSWKDIPMETVEKSKRLKKITQTGGRTTLYGRIDYDKPSYTITTYFNRPGNGTYVHPSHERVISVREAARFQTFRDDYYFFGNKTQTLKQVGNAVPTILAYQIAKNIVSKTGCNKSIDLFCGAGGMTAGFKAAGINALLSNDIEESACKTLKINNPEIPVLCGDITLEETKAAIEKAAKLGGADIICGGPPCQGFSMAGFRSDTDPRNQLFREFVDIVKRVDPKIIVFENVEGLLSYQGGKTYREVLTLFSELGYIAEGRTLTTTEYAVPQKRKRVIIICTRKDICVNPSSIFPDAITKEAKSQITARDTIFDLDGIECSENALYTAQYKSNMIDFFRNQISYQEFIDVSKETVDEKEYKFDDEPTVAILDDGQLKLIF